MAMLLVHLLALAGGPLLLSALLLSALLAARNKTVPYNPKNDPVLIKQTLRFYDVAAVVSVTGTLVLTAWLACTGILVEMDSSAWLWALSIAAPIAWLIFWDRAAGERAEAEHAPIRGLGTQGLVAKYITGTMVALTMISAIAVPIAGIFSLTSGSPSGLLQRV